MILIVGACASGKRTFAGKLGFCEEQTADAAALAGLPPERLLERLSGDARPAVRNVQAVAGGAPVRDLAEALDKKACVICTDTGSGVVPADARQRLAREAAGRLSIELAARADCVVRMVCGIPQVLKGVLPDGGARG